MSYLAYRAKVNQKCPRCPLKTNRCARLLHTGGYLWHSQLLLKPGHRVCVREGGGRQDGRQTLTLKEGRRPEGRATVRGPATVLLY